MLLKSIYSQKIVIQLQKCTPRIGVKVKTLIQPSVKSSAFATTKLEILNCDSFVHLNTQRLVISLHHTTRSSLVANSFLLADGLAYFMQSADVEALTPFGDHVLFNKTGQLALFCQHLQECCDKLIVVVRSTTIIDLQMHQKTMVMVYGICKIQKYLRSITS